MLAYYKCTCLLSMWLPHIPTYTRRNGARFLLQVYRKDTSLCPNNLISILVRNSISASWFVGTFDCRRVGLLASWSVGELVCRRFVQLPSALFNNSVGKCCLHSFYYFFDILSLQRQHHLPWSESELTIPGTKVPLNGCSREQKFPGTFVPRSDSSWKLSFLGTRVLSENTGERKVLILLS